MILWCDGLKTRAGSKRYPSNDDNTSNSAKKGTQERVKQVVDVLKKQHGKKYTSMQYCLWVEMVSIKV